MEMRCDFYIEFALFKFFILKYFGLFLIYLKFMYQKYIIVLIVFWLYS